MVSIFCIPNHWLTFWARVGWTIAAFFPWLQGSSCGVSTPAGVQAKHVVGPCFRIGVEVWNLGGFLWKEHTAWSEVLFYAYGICTTTVTYSENEANIQIFTKSLYSMFNRAKWEKNIKLNSLIICCVWVIMQQCRKYYYTQQKLTNLHIVHCTTRHCNTRKQDKKKYRAAERSDSYIVVCDTLTCILSWFSFTRFNIQAEET